MRDLIERLDLAVRAGRADFTASLAAFRLSVPVAVALCLLLASLFMRSLRYGAVSTVPVLLVVAWLYAFMYVTGYAITTSIDERPAFIRVSNCCR